MTWIGIIYDINDIIQILPLFFSFIIEKTAMKNHVIFSHNLCSYVTDVDKLIKSHG